MVLQKSYRCWIAALLIKQLKVKKADMYYKYVYLLRTVPRSGQNTKKIAQFFSCFGPFGEPCDTSFSAAPLKVCKPA